MTLFLAALALTARVTEWEHYPHYGGGNSITSRNELLLAGTSGGILFAHYDEQTGKLQADSGWTYPERLSWDRVSHIVFDSNDNMWVSLSGGGIDVFSPQGDKTHFNQIDGLPLNLVINQTLPDSVIYVATSQGLCIREFGYFEIWDSYETSGGLPSDNITCLAQSDSGLYAGTTAGLVFLPRSADPGLSSSWELQDIDESSVVDLAWNGDTLWAAVGEKLFIRYPDGSWEQDILFPGGSIYSLSSGNGGMAAGCLNSSYIRQNGSWTALQGDLSGNALTGLVWHQGMLTGVLANSLSNDRASGAGVVVLTEEQGWRRTFPDLGPISNDLRACALLSDKSLWVTGNRSGASALYQGSWQNLLGYMSSGSQCFALAPSGNGAFISSLGTGVDWLGWENGQVTSSFLLTSEDGLPNNRVFNAVSTGDGTVWFAHRTLFETEEAGVSRLSWLPGDSSSISISVISGAGGLPSKEVNCVLPEGSRYALAGTDEGLARVDGNTQTVVQTWTSQNGLPSSLVTALAEDRSGNVFIGTASGLAMFQGTEITPLDDVDLSVEALACDYLGSVWISSTEGLSRYYPSTGVLEAYTAFNSPVLEGNIYCFAVDSDGGFIWMATDHGLWRGTLEASLNGSGAAPLPYPNPFIPEEGVTLGVSGIPEEPADFTIFDLTGSVVYRYSSAGRDDFSWDGTTGDGTQAASGVYYLMIQGGSYTAPLMKFALVR